MDSLTGQTLFKADGSSALADDVLSGKVVKDSGIEIVFVSSDKSPGDMINYMKESHGDWYSVKHSSPLAVQLKEKYGITGIPCLIVCKKNGSIVTKEGRNHVSGKEPTAAVRDWKK